MRTNGYITVLTTSGATTNDFGELEFSEVEWSEAIPCLIKTNNDTRKGEYDGGEYREASFTVLVERPIPLNIQRVRLERYDDDLGEFEIQSIEPLPGMGRVQIVV